MEGSPATISEARIEKHTIDPDGDCILHLQENATREVISLVASAEEPSDDNPFHEPVVEVIKHVQVQVSSRHLMLASPVFRAMLHENNRFKEGEELLSKGNVEIDLEDDKPHSFVILMNVIHGRSSKLPEVVNLKTLHAIALLVDKYQMHDAGKMCSHIWIKSIHKIGALYPRYLVRQGENRTVNFSLSDAQLTEHIYWLCIAWVFDNEDVFERVTSNLIGEIEFDGQLSMAILKEKLVIPMPDSIIVAIEKQREKLICDAIELFVDNISLYRTAAKDQRTICDGQEWIDKEKERKRLQSCCDAMTLGRILSGPAACLALENIPQPPYDHHSFYDIHHAIEKTNMQDSFCSISRPSDFTGARQKCTSNKLKDGFTIDLEEIFHGAEKGLDIDRFKRKVTERGTKRKYGD